MNSKTSICTSTENLENNKQQTGQRRYAFPPNSIFAKLSLKTNFDYKI